MKEHMEELEKGPDGYLHFTKDYVVKARVERHRENQEIMKVVLMKAAVALAEISRATKLVDSFDREDNDLGPGVAHAMNVLGSAKGQISNTLLMILTALQQPTGVKND